MTVGPSRPAGPPRFIQSIMTVKGLYDSKPAKLWLMGQKAEGDLKRPWLAAPSMFGAFLLASFWRGPRRDWLWLTLGASDRLLVGTRRWRSRRYRRRPDLGGRHQGCREGGQEDQVNALSQKRLVSPCQFVYPLSRQGPRAAERSVVFGFDDVRVANDRCSLPRDTGLANNEFEVG